jgi:ribosomal protein S18 acetylase RimI-like enzyme
MTIECGRDIELHTLCIAPSIKDRVSVQFLQDNWLKPALARKRGLVLSVLKVNTAARSFFDRLGFVLTEDSAHHYRNRLPS